MNTTLLLGTLLFVVVGPLLGVVTMPFLIRHPESRFEFVLGSLSLGFGLTAGVLDLVYRVNSLVGVRNFRMAMAATIGVCLLVVLLVRLFATEKGPKEGDLFWSIPLGSAAFRIVLGLHFVVALYVLFVPAHGNDPLEYFAVADLWQRLGPSSYPSVTGSLEGLVVAPSSHPTSYHSMIAALGLLGPTAIFHAVYITGFIGSVVYLSGFVRKPTLTLLAFLSMPLLLLQLSTRGVDPFTVAGLIPGCLIVITQASRLNRRNLNEWSSSVGRGLLAGVGAALIIGRHSSGLLFLSTLLLAMIVVLRFSPRVLTVLAVALGLALILSPQYLINLSRFGSPVQDTAAVFEIAELEYDVDLELRRGLSSTGERLWRGALRGFFDPLFFGFTPWAALISTVTLVRKQEGDRHETVERVFLVTAALILMLFVMSAFVGISLVIKNPRYWLLLAVPSAVLAGSFRLGNSTRG